MTQQSTFTDTDRKHLLNAICEAKHGYIEYGMGESTSMLIANRPELPSCSVESDRDFLMAWRDAQPESYKQSNHVAVHAFIGPTKGWGYPANDRFRHLWPAYCMLPFAISEQACNADVVFVDGRFRVACALNALLSITRNFTLLVHDFNRIEYYVLLKYFEYEQATDFRNGDSLVVLRPKHNWSWQDVRADFAKLIGNMQPAC